MSETPQNPALSGTLFLFEKPEIVSRELHGDYGVSTTERPFYFCENARVLPLNANEIISAQKSFPVVFTEGDTPIPLAAVGVIDDRNLFVDDQGNWAEDVYVPNYIRRYPFALAADNQSDRMALVVDAGYQGFVKNPERPLFTGEGTSELGDQALESCRLYEQERQRTVEFGKILKQHDLLTNQVANFSQPGQEGQGQPFAQYFAVDENKLKALPADAFIQLRDSGALPLIYAHLMSIANWRRLVERRARRFNLNESNVLQPLPANGA
ncbi:MAG: SapC family protein [Pseudomonadota bacterium]